MIRWTPELDALEAREDSGPVDFERNRQVFASMLQLAKQLGAWPPRIEDDAHRLEHKLRVARVINGISAGNNRSEVR